MSDLRDRINNYFEEMGETVVLLEPESLDSAIVGVTENKVVYSYDKLVEAYYNDYIEELPKPLSDEDQEQAETDAIEWVNYNTLRAIPYMGENAPLIIYETDYI